MLSLQRKMVETASLLHNTRDRHGDLIFGTPTTLACLYRDISTLRQVNYQEGVSIEGYFWFYPDSGVVKGDTIAYSGEHFRIMKVIKGKRTMTDDTVDFLKCEVIRLKQVS